MTMTDWLMIVVLVQSTFITVLSCLLFHLLTRR